MPLTIGIPSFEESYHAKWEEFLKARGVGVKRIDFQSRNIIREASEFDGVMWKFGLSPDKKRLAFNILDAIEFDLGLPVFPDYLTRRHYDNKLMQYYVLKSHCISIPETYVYWQRDKALEWARYTSYPKIAKLSSGASSNGVRMLHSKHDAIKWIKDLFSMHGRKRYSENQLSSPLRRMIMSMLSGLPLVMADLAEETKSRFPSLDNHYWTPEKNYALFQEFVPENEYDIRITVIGERAFAFTRINRPNDFRASGSGQIDYDKNKIDNSLLTHAFDCAAKLQMQSVAFDFIYKGKEPLLLEISYAYNDEAVFQCGGYWTQSLEWIDKPMWPEEAHVIDFLEKLTKG